MVYFTYRAELVKKNWKLLRYKNSVGRGFVAPRGVYPAFSGARGEICSNYLQNRAPVRNCQICGVRIAPLGDQFVGNLGRKKPLSVL